jgi:serine/threonine protein kinase
MRIRDVYEILIGQDTGSTAQVYLARHKEFEYQRALRIVKKKIYPDINPKDYEKFINESKTLLRLGNGSHPNIIRIYHPYVIDGDAFWEMDYIDGLTVCDFIKERNGYLPIDEILNFLKDISSALAYCHVDNYMYSLDKAIDLKSDENITKNSINITLEKENELIKKYCVVHNDIKSNNIMRKKYDGSYILLDFGLSFNHNKGLVRSSIMADGGVEYKAPEKWDLSSEYMTERTDIYSFGILLFEMLTGRVPFLIDNNIPIEQAVSKASNQHKNEATPEIEPLRKEACEKAGIKWEGKDYPDWLEKIVLKCLEKKPEKRYANGKELYTEFKSYIEEYRNILKQKKEVTQKSEESYNDLQQKQKNTLFEKEYYIYKHDKNIRENDIKMRQERKKWITGMIVLALFCVGFACAWILNFQIDNIWQSVTNTYNKNYESYDATNLKLSDKNDQHPFDNNNSELSELISIKDNEISLFKTQLEAVQVNLTKLEKSLMIKDATISILNEQIKGNNTEIDNLKKALDAALK